MKRWKIWAVVALAFLIGGGSGIYAASTFYTVTSLLASDLARIYGSPGSTRGYAPANAFLFGAGQTTGSSTQTFTNSPCHTTNIAQWIPIFMPGYGNVTLYVPACM